MHDPSAYGRWFDVLFHTALKDIEVEVHAVGKVPGSWIEYIKHNYDWVRDCRMCPVEDGGALLDDGFEGGEVAVKTLVGLLKCDQGAIGRRVYVPLQGMISIDASAMDALGIVTTSGGSSVFDMVVAHCMTAQGRQCMKEWFMFPLSSEEIRRSRLDLIEGFLSNRHIMSSARKILKRIGNPMALVGTLWKNQTLPKPVDQTRNFMKLRDSLEALIKLQEVCRNSSGYRLSCLSQDTAMVILQIGSLIDKVVDMEQLPEGMCIHYGVSQELDTLKSTYFGMDMMMRKLVMLERDRIPKSLGGSRSETCAWEMVHIHQVGIFIHCPLGMLPLYLEEYLTDWELVFEPGSLQQYEGALYSADSCMELYKRFGSVFPRILDLEAAMCNMLTCRISKEKESLEGAFNVVANLDCILAFATFSMEQNMSRPQYSSVDTLSIRGGWNPIVLHSTTMNASKCIPNDTIVQGEQRTHLVIGKGGTGKSVYLQQISIIVFLAHIGCYVPAKQASIPSTIERIHCMLSSQESLCDSSFSHGLKKILEMLLWGSSTSLFLIESFGKATVSSDGIALAASVIHSISKKGGMLFFATYMGQTFLDQLAFMKSLKNQYKVYYLMSTRNMGEQTNLFKIKAEEEIEDLEIEDIIVCEECPSIAERAQHIHSLISKASTQHALERCQTFSLVKSLVQVQRLKSICSKSEAIGFIEDLA